ncbi:MAG: phosphoenolpyruvate--protein phosphotransferase [Acidobacteria bacterium SCN 69-37]|nr:MAG: phosphoenolpyruvate--protein phosphotransferase [Acidobacteria bacterium SCN 69-37]
MAVGGAVVVVREATQIRYRLAASGVDRERQRLRAARDRTRRDLEEISERLARTIGPAQASIFAAQGLMLDDPLLLKRADELIRTDRINAEWAIERVIGDLQATLAREGDEWLRERGGDVADVGGRLQRNLRPEHASLADRILDIPPPVVLVADELPPSVAAQLDWSHVTGLVCDAGSPTSHTIILVRSLGVPAVVGAGRATHLVAPGQTIALDGVTGDVVVDPDDDVLEGWRHRAALAASAAHAFDALRDRPATTADGTHIRLEANLEIADEVARVRDAGAEGIGLFRSEFLLDMDGADEEAQTATYRSLLATMAPLPVTIRTFDAAGDWRSVATRGPAHRDRFGVRGIRTVRHRDERFRTQIRALLRAADAGVLRILLPFVTTGDELRGARTVIEEIARDLGVATVPIGAMIEVPAAALTIDALAEHAEFLSVGTNDLIQYTLAVDRTDDRLAREYAATSPAVLRLLRTSAVQARRSHCEVSVCGEMAADPLLVPLLVGLGFRRFSMAPAAILGVKHALSALDVRQAVMLARQAVLARSAHEVDQLLASMAKSMREAVDSSAKEPA